MKRNLLIAALLAGLAVSPESARAQTENPPADASHKFVGELSRRYNVPEAEITALRDTGMGWGEISHALAISQKSGKPLSDVMALRDSGLGWGEIARKYGFKLGDVKREARGIGRRGPPPSHGRHAHPDHPRGGPKGR